MVFRFTVRVRGWLLVLISLNKARMQLLMERSR